MLRTTRVGRCQMWCMDLTTTSIKVVISCSPFRENKNHGSGKLKFKTLVLTGFVLFPPADDCQQMFLHPVNIRCLLREYGSLEASPDYITAAVVEIVGHTVTEVSRHRPTLRKPCCSGSPSASSQLTSVIFEMVAGDPPPSSIPGSPAAHVRVQHL